MSDPEAARWERRAASARVETPRMLAHVTGMTSACRDVTDRTNACRDVIDKTRACRDVIDKDQRVPRGGFKVQEQERK
jgi:hypothetical protein